LKLKQQETYWLGEFAQEPPALDLPADYPRDWERDFSGNTVLFGLTILETQQLKKIARDTESTLFMVTLWIFLILLYRLSGQEEIVIGVPVSGRQHPDLEGIIGVFINSLAIRFNVQDNQTALELIETVKEKWLKAFENQDYPFEELVSKVSQNRDSGRNPLFDVMLNYIHWYENTGVAPGPVAHNPGDQYIHNRRTSKFDLSVDVLTYSENLFFSFEYSTQLFKTETIDKFLDCFKGILTIVLSNPRVKLTEIEIDPEYKALNTNIFDNVDDF
ncbi:MAG TPA: condensation domain-containing protein, partial [Candidatus Deferrimicrobium sp.]|nr:condensation domain-containing protein [Candidatus Deferrimicrobium sp.]